ncbi:MAG TPA: type II and III secretion system protein [Candidatus Binatus sp.]|jgi:general secretion pathway protein D|nr:type II and III secretion system protein [Candidatus Binatus sp.]
MRRLIYILAAGLVTAVLAAPALAAGDDALAPPPMPCGAGIPGGVNCMASKQDLKLARTAFKKGVKLQEARRLEEAFARFDDAARLAPQNMQFLTARELVKAQLVYNHVERGNVLMLENARPRAAAEFRAALNLDVENQFVRERLQEATRELVPAKTWAVPVQLVDSGEIHLEPGDGRATFHYTGDVRGLFAGLAAAYGVNPQFDDSVQTRQVRFNVDDVDFFTALKLACQVSKTMWAALDRHQLLIASDNTENHKQFDRMSLRTFILPPHSTPQEVTDLVTTMRNMFDLQFVSSGLTGDSVEVRGPQRLLDACSTLLAQLSNPRPQVMIEVRVYQIDHQLTKNIGVHIPNTFNMFNIPAIALIGLGGQSISQLVNQLIASGGINQAGTTGIAGLLAQLEGQGNSIFSQPLATFGGGLTFSGVSLDHLAANLSVNESWVRSLSNLNLRASQGNDATFHLGTKYPIENASFAPIFNSAAISAVLGNQTFVPPFPSITYEDLGLNMKAKPVIHGDGSVSLEIDLEVRSLTGQSNNGIPVISNREYKGSINLRDGEPAVVAGEVSKTDMISMSGIPGLGLLPGLNQALVNNTKESDSDELMIVVTPHVLANFNRTTPEIWVTEK